jgi:hypothetical protein
MTQRGWRGDLQPLFYQDGICRVRGFPFAAPIVYRCSKAGLRGKVMDIGFGELFDRVESHTGPRFTKTIIYLAGFTLIAFCLKSIFDYVVAPLIKVGPSLSTALTWSDYFRVGATIAIGFVGASMLLDYYRIKRLRESLEETVGDSHELMDRIKATRDSYSVDREEMMGEVNQLMVKVETTLVRAHELKSAAILIAEEMLQQAERSEPVTPKTLAALRELVEIAGQATETLRHHGLPEKPMVH